MDKVVYSTFASMFKGGHKICCCISIIVATMICENKLCLYTKPTSSKVNGNILSTMISGVTLNYSNLILVFKGLGIVIAILGLLSSFVLLANSGLVESKDSYVNVITRFILSLLIVLLINGFTLQCLKFGTQIEKSISNVLMLDKVQGSSLFGQGLLYNMTTNAEDKDGIPVVNWLKEWNKNSQGSAIVGDGSIFKNVLSTILDVQYGLLASIVNFIAALILTWNLIKLAFELIRRFAMTQILQMISPIFGGFFASSSSMNVFTSYLKMFVTEIGIYLMTKIWFVTSVMLLSSEEAATSLASIIMIYTFVIVGNKMEGIARDLGLTTSTQGAALLDSMIMNGVIMGGALSGLKGAVGNGIFSFGALKGNAKVAGIGAAMAGRNIDYSPAGLQKAIQGSIPGQMRKAATANKDKSNLTKSMKSAAFDAIKQGGFQGKNSFSDIAGQLNSAGKKELYDALANDFYRMPNGMSLGEEYGQRMNLTGYDNGVATGTICDSSGKDLANFSISSSIPQNGNYQKITDANGDAKYMSFNPIQDQSQLSSTTGSFYNNGSAENLLSPDRGITDAEAATGCMLNTSNKLYRSADGTLDTVGSNYSTCALGDNVYGIMHTDPTTGNEQISSVDFGGGKVAQHGYAWNNLADVGTKSDIQDYFSNNLGQLDKNATRISAIAPTGNDRFTISYSATKDGENVLMKKEFARVTSASTSKLGDVDSLARIRTQRFYGDSAKGHWIGSKPQRVKKEENKK